LTLIFRRELAAADFVLDPRGRSALEPGADGHLGAVAMGMVELEGAFGDGERQRA
jgi:hypothetical protein